MPSTAGIPATTVYMPRTEAQNKIFPFRNFSVKHHRAGAMIMSSAISHLHLTSANLIYIQFSEIILSANDITLSKLYMHLKFFFYSNFQKYSKSARKMQYFSVIWN